MRINPMKTGAIILLSVLLLGDSMMDTLGVRMFLLVALPLFLLAFALINYACSIHTKYIWIGRWPKQKQKKI